MLLIHAIVFALHHQALSDGYPHTVWISNILSRPVADLFTWVITFHLAAPILL